MRVALLDLCSGGFRARWVRDVIAVLGFDQNDTFQTQKVRRRCGPAAILDSSCPRPTCTASVWLDTGPWLYDKHVLCARASRRQTLDGVGADTARGERCSAQQRRMTDGDQRQHGAGDSRCSDGTSGLKRGESCPTPSPRPLSVALPRALWEHLQSHDGRVAPPGFASQRLGRCCRLGHGDEIQEQRRRSWMRGMCRCEGLYLRTCVPAYLRTCVLVYLTVWAWKHRGQTCWMPRATEYRVA